MLPHRPGAPDDRHAPAPPSATDQSEGDVTLLARAAANAAARNLCTDAAIKSEAAGTDHSPSMEAREPVVDDEKPR